MAWDVHIHVCFPCSENEGVAALAKKHLDPLTDESDGHQAAIWFLKDLSGRTGHNPGPKGGLSLWGMVGNYTNVSTFCDVLRPFWMELLSGVEGGPLDFEHILVFEEQEQSGAATAHEIFLEDGALVIRKHERLPFSWAQA